MLAGATLTFALVSATCFRIYRWEIAVMTLWDDLEGRIRAQGVRVDERLRLLAMLRDAGAEEDPVGREANALLQAIKDAATRVKSDIG